MKIIIKQDDIKEYQNLIEECIVIISELSFSQALTEIEKRHKVGEAIFNSPLYKKYSKGGGEFLDRIAKDLNKSRSWIYESVKFYEKYKDIGEFISKFAPEKKIIRWADVRKVLPSPDGCKHEKTEIEIIEIHREKCVDCGKIVKEEKIKQ